MDITKDACARKLETSTANNQEQTGKPPLVLILNVRAIRPLVDTHKQFIRTIPVNKRRDVEFGWIARALGVTDEDAIYPDVVSAVNSIKAQTKLVTRVP